VNVPLLDLVAQYRAIKDESCLPSRRSSSRSSSSWVQPCRGSRLPWPSSPVRRTASRAQAAPTRCCCPSRRSTSSPGRGHHDAVHVLRHRRDDPQRRRHAGVRGHRPGTFNIDPAAVEAAFTPRTRAIVPVHLYGQMAAMERLRAIARTRDLPSSRTRRRRSARAARSMALADGGRARMGYRVLLLSEQELGAWGDGGMMSPRTPPSRAAPEAPPPRRGDGVPPRRGGHQFAARFAPGGRPARETAAPCGMVGEATGACGVLHARARRSLGGPAAGVDPRTSTSSSVHSARRAPGRAAGAPQAPRIGSAIYYPVPLQLQPCFSHLGYRPGRLPESERASAEVLSLPVYPELTREQLDCVIETIGGFYR